MTAKKTKPRKSLTVTCLLDLLERSTTRDLHYLGEEPIVFARELREKVEELLKELEKEKKEIERKMNKNIYENSDEDYLNGLRNGYIVAIELIKKAFRGVLDEDNR